jgi:integrase
MTVYSIICGLRGIYRNIRYNYNVYGGMSPQGDGTLSMLSGRTVRGELKRTCEANDLPASYFSSHSLRKGGITHMRAQGSTEEDRRDRGNYSAGSQVMNNTYDYATGLGRTAWREDTV